MLKRYQFYTILFVILGIFAAMPVFASDIFTDINNGLDTFNDQAGLPKTEINNAAGTIIKKALSLLGIFTLIIIMYGGFLWMISGGNEERKSQAKGVFINGIIGLVIILLAYSIVTYVFDIFQGASVTD